MHTTDMLRSGQPDTTLESPWLASRLPRLHSPLPSRRQYIKYKPIHPESTPITNLLYWALTLWATLHLPWALQGQALDNSGQLQAPDPTDIIQTKPKPAWPPSLILSAETRAKVSFLPSASQVTVLLAGSIPVSWCALSLVICDYVTNRLLKKKIKLVDYFKLLN